MADKVKGIVKKTDDKESVKANGSQGIWELIKGHVNLLSSSLILAYVTLLGYVLAYAKELAIYGHYHLSTHFIEISLEDILLSVLVAVILMGLYLSYLEMRDGIAKKINRKIRIILRYSLLMILAIVVVLVIMCQLFLVRYNQSMLFFVAVVVLMTVSVYEVKKPILRGIMTAVGGFAIAYIAGFIMGWASVPLKSEYQIIVDDPKQVIIADYKDGYIVAPITDELSIVPLYSYYEASHDTQFYTLRCVGNSVKVQELSTYTELADTYNELRDE